jgi:hypothetical protein
MAVAVGSRAAHPLKSATPAHTGRRVHSCTLRPKHRQSPGPTPTSAGGPVPRSTPEHHQLPTVTPAGTRLPVLKCTLDLARHESAIRASTDRPRCTPTPARHKSIEVRLTPIRLIKCNHRRIGPTRTALCEYASAFSRYLPKIDRAGRRSLRRSPPPIIIICS